MGTDISIYSVLSIWILFTTYTVSKRSTIFKHYFSGVLFAAAPAEAVLLTVIFPLTSISFNICITVIT